MLDAKIPDGPVEQKWPDYKGHCKLVNPANKRKMEIIIIGTGLAGASAAAALGELGYKVKAFCYQDSPRRAHSIAAQGGINAAKNYQNDGDSVFRLFYDTIKGGDYRAREGNVHRLAEVSVNIIDQCVAQGVPFAREYGGLLSNRSFGGTQVQRTFYAAGQTGQQLLIGAYQALERQIALGNVKMYNRHEMLDIVKIDGKTRGIIARNLVSGELERHSGYAVLLCSGGYGNVFYLSTNAMGSNVTAAWKAHKKGAYFANPCFTQIHPTCIPVSGEHQSKLTLMSESLRNDGRIWVPKKQNDTRSPKEIPEEERDYYLERRYPAFGNLVPRDVASRAAKERCDAGHGVGTSKQAVYLDYADAIMRYGKIEAGKKDIHNAGTDSLISMGREVVKEKYGNLFDMYEKITGENPYELPMRIYPAVHYTMGGVWVDYELQTTVPGLYALGEANFSDHGANRLGASALMQGLADGYFVIPYTIGNFLADEIRVPPTSVDHPAFLAAEKEVSERINKLLSIKGKTSVETFHKRLGKIMWDKCGMARNAKGLQEAITEIRQLKADFWSNVRIPGEANEMNNELDKAGRVADFIELGELMCMDALERNESCGGHFREEYQTGEGEALRDDANYLHVAAWEYKGEHNWEMHKEELTYEVVKLTARSYKYFEDLKEKLIIKNFGPIKSVELTLGRFNVLIGDQGTGKSTVAKLLTTIESTFFKELIDVPEDEEINRETQLFFEYLKWFEIINYYNEKTEIQYSNQLYSFQLKNKFVEIKKNREPSLEENTSYDINYILAERILAVTLENSLYALIETRAYLPRLFLRFGNKFQKARKEQQTFDYTNIIGIKYTYKDDKSIIILPSGKEISINEASTGIQGAVSLLTVFDSITRQVKNKISFLQNSNTLLNYLIIEEPEMNCFPETQNKLLMYLVEKIVDRDNLGKHHYKNRLLLTTHSPYILTSINNLIFSYKVGQTHKDETDKVIEQKYWVNPDDVSVYMMLANGDCEDIFDREEGLVKAEKIDGITNTLNEQFSSLLNLEFAANEFNT